MTEATSRNPAGHVNASIVNRHNAAYAHAEPTLRGARRARNGIIPGVARCCVTAQNGSGTPSIPLEYWKIFATDVEDAFQPVRKTLFRRCLTYIPRALFVV